MLNFKTAEEKARERAADAMHGANACAYWVRHAFVQSHALRVHAADVRAAMRRKDWAGVRLHAAAAAVSQARILDAARFVESERARLDGIAATADEIAAAAVCDSQRVAACREKIAEMAGCNDGTDMTYWRAEMARAEDRIIGHASCTLDLLRAASQQ